MMGKILLVAALAACQGTVVEAHVDPCLDTLYRSPMCDATYHWEPGYYNSFHVWVGPRYIARGIHVPSPVIVHTPPVVVRTPPVVARPAPVIVRPPAAAPRVVPPTRTYTPSGRTGGSYSPTGRR